MALVKIREELCCSLCLDIYSDPVCLSCGHNFCRKCIENTFESQKGDRAYSCPECRALFKKKPELIKSRKLCNITEHLFSDKKDGTVLCTYCIGFNTHAVKRCLLCEAFLCEEHLKVHSKSQEHILTETISSKDMDSERMCTLHKELLVYYCCLDDAFLCASCLNLGNHGTHRIETLSNSSKHKKEEVKDALDKMLTIRKTFSKKIHGLKGQIKQVQDKATGIRIRVINLFVDIRKQVDELENQVLVEINRQKDDVYQQIYEQIQQLELQKDELYQKILHAEELFGLNDTISFLKESKSLLCSFPTYENNMKMQCNRTGSANHQLDDGLISVTLENNLLSLVKSILKLKTNQFNVEDDSGIVMDCDSANDKVALSNDLKTISCSKSEIQKPIKPAKFSSSQVLTTTGFKSGEHYLEIEVSSMGYWIIGMVYPSIRRTGNDSLIGCNNKSWGVALLNDNLSALHNAESKSIQVNSPLQVIGIHLNYEAGELSFYQISRPVKHLHTFKSTFSEPLYPAFYVSGNSWTKINN
ncbi:E3 ubiquitin/ISG15 ligase TRIM25-like [Hyperolius riggenbachi]|uniref:E3 ubiquitin/ISG15 ligase TRIM25-like n=1 Tax=Hyperolius riggenbachi TaxID=752182 RepID=UPI0035A302E6